KTARSWAEVRRVSGGGTDAGLSNHHAATRGSRPRGPGTGVMGDNARIIVADDHPLFREALQQALAPMMPGVSFVEAESFDSLQAAIGDSEDVDLVLLDLEMPGAQGFSVLAWLRTQHPALPVVVVSAISAAVVMRPAVDLGAS